MNTKAEKIEYIRNVCAERGITAYQIALKAKMSAPGVSKILSGHTKNPNEATVNLILETINDKPKPTIPVEVLELIKSLKHQIALLESTVTLHEHNAELLQEKINRLMSLELEHS